MVPDVDIHIRETQGVILPIASLLQDYLPGAGKGESALDPSPVDSVRGFLAAI